MWYSPNTYHYKLHKFCPSSILLFGVWHYISDEVYITLYQNIRLVNLLRNMHGKYWKAPLESKRGHYYIFELGMMSTLLIANTGSGASSIFGVFEESGWKVSTHLLMILFPHFHFRPKAVQMLPEKRECLERTTTSTCLESCNMIMQFLGD